MVACASRFASLLLLICRGLVVYHISSSQPWHPVGAVDFLGDGERLLGEGERLLTGEGDLLLVGEGDLLLAGEVGLRRGEGGLRTGHRTGEGDLRGEGGLRMGEARLGDGGLGGVHWGEMAAQAAAEPLWTPKKMCLYGVELLVAVTACITIVPVSVQAKLRPVSHELAAEATSKR